MVRDVGPAHMYMNAQSRRMGSAHRRLLYEQEHLLQSDITIPLPNLRGWRWMIPDNRGIPNNNTAHGAVVDNAPNVQLGILCQGTISTAPFFF
mmetsp:Transcript_22216/g.61894  ORF Transcript_22216/g.61894 Transcript_22216/m.61894 type:complete len:93 (-) Transcript_22216:122-400(-)